MRIVRRKGLATLGMNPQCQLPKDILLDPF